MATTSLWHIKGSLSDLIAYVENPEKTATKGTEDFFNVFSYIQNPQKTEDGSFVTAINCLKQTALRQMILTKQRYGKEDKYITCHGYQSFKPGEVTPKRCHEIGVKLAREMWGERFQVIITTHLDKGHLHFIRFLVFPLSHFLHPPFLSILLLFCELNVSTFLYNIKSCQRVALFFVLCKLL